MKAETKAKIQVKLNRAWETVKPWIVPTLVVGTIAAAWDGCVQGNRNERELERMRKNNLDAACNYLSDRIKLEERLEKLEKQNEKLLNEAMDFTEGKEPA